MASPISANSAACIDRSITRFRLSGFEVIDGVVDRGCIDSMIALAEPMLATGDGEGESDGGLRCKPKRPGVRRVLVREPRLVEVLRRTAIPGLIEGLLGINAIIAQRDARVPRTGAGVTRTGSSVAGGEASRSSVIASVIVPSIVRSILFDKTPETNWLVPWHQDPLIAVAEKREDVAGFGPWSVKDGEPHCKPPIEILRSIVTIRIHLDACPTDAGPLRGVLASHKLGVVKESEIDAVVRAGEVVEAVTEAGGVVIMSPLTMHSSPKATRLAAADASGGRRRVLHLDCSAAELPHGLRWAERVHL